MHRAVKPGCFANYNVAFSELAAALQNFSAFHALLFGFYYSKLTSCPILVVDYSYVKVSGSEIGL